MDHTQRPGKIQTIGTLRLIAGIWHILFGIAGAIYFFIFGGAMALTTCIGGIVMFCGVPYIFLVVFGILEIVSGAKHLKKDTVTLKPSKWMAIIQLIFILGCDPIGLGVGITTLVFMGDDEVKQYYASMAPR